MEAYDLFVINMNKKISRQLFSTLKAHDCKYATITTPSTLAITEGTFNRSFQIALISLDAQQGFNEFDRVLELITASSSGIHVIALFPRDQLASAAERYGEQIYDYMAQPCEVNKATKSIVNLLALKKMLKDNRAITEANKRLAIDPKEVKKRTSQLSYYYTQFGALRKLIYSTVVTGEVTDLIKKTPDIINKILPYDKLSFFLTDPGGESLSLAVSRGRPNSLPDKLSFRWGEGLAGHIAESKKALVCKNRLAHKAFVILHDSTPKKRTLMGTPLRVKGKILGVMIQERDTAKGAYSKSDLDFFTTIAAQISVGMENARIYKSIREGNIELERRIKELTTMFDISKAVQSIIDDQQALFDVIVQKVARLLEVERSSIMTLDESGEVLQIVASVGVPEKIAAATKVKLGESISGNVAARGVPLLIEDVETDEAVKRINKEQYYTKSCMCVPIKIKDNLMGVINVSNKRTRDVFSQEDLNLLVAIATTVGQTIENRRLLKNLMEKEGEKLKLKDSFQKYVAPQVVEQILNNPDFVNFQGRRTKVTVLMAGIANFSEIVWKLPAGEVVKFMNEYLTEMTRVIFEHEGTLDKFIGDTVMAIFGAPIPRADASVAASRAAIDMVLAFNRLVDTWEQEERAGREFVIRAAVKTGEAVVGNIGSNKRLEYTVIGDTVNTCARFKSVASGGQIIIGDETLGELPTEEFSTEKLPSVELKGKAEKTQIYLLKVTEEENRSASAQQE